MRVKLVSKTIGLNDYSRLNSEEIISAIARHGSIKEDNGRLIRYLMTHKHWSPLEFINLTFQIETSRAIGRQIMRHRSFSGIQEWSQRYEDEISFQNFEIRKQAKKNRQSSTEEFDPIVWDTFSDVDLTASEQIENLLLNIRETYKELIRVGVAKECARMILPECTTTILHLNGSLRTWLSFLNVRIHKDSQKEIRDIAKEVGNILDKEFPNVFDKIDWKNGLFM